MRILVTWTMNLLLLPTVLLLATTATAAVPLPDGVKAAPESFEPQEVQEAEPQDPPPKADRPRRVRDRRGPDRRGPGGLPGSMPPRGQMGRGPEAMLDRLPRLIAERHPELAKRLEQVRERSPEEFRRLLADALALRFEEALERQERGARPPRGRGRGWDESPPERGQRGVSEERRAMRGRSREGAQRRWREGERREPRMAIEREMEGLHRHNEELERRSGELARRFHELRERHDPEQEGERGEVHRQIEETVEKHFNVRTELRRFELRRIEMELDHLREMLERIRHDLERREESRGAIIERRLSQLLGEDAEGW